MKNVFVALPNLQYVKTLGYGGNGIAMRYRNTILGQPYDFVVKVSIRNWESATLRAEIRETMV